MKKSWSDSVVLRFVKAFVFGFGGLSALGSAMALIMGSSLPGTPVNREPAPFLLCAGVGLIAVGLYELLHGVQVLVNNLNTSFKATRRSNE